MIFIFLGSELRGEIQQQVYRTVLDSDLFKHYLEYAIYRAGAP
jgi:hypothetical protein